MAKQFDNVVPFGNPGSGGALVPPGEPPHDGDMQERLAKLEAIVPTLATKSDVAEVRADLHKISSETKGWFIATAVLILVGMFTIANIMITNVRAIGDKPAQPPVLASPYIIQIPAPPEAQKEPAPKAEEKQQQK